jgi:hypothetical protein
MSNPELFSMTAELTNCSNEVYGSPLHGTNAMNYLQWLRFPPGRVWYDRGQYFVSSVMHGNKDPQEIEVPYGTSEEVVLAQGVSMVQQQLKPAYEIVARPPIGTERGHDSQTLAVLDKGPYSVASLSAYVQHRKIAEHTLHGSLGALFDTLSIVAGAKQAAEVVGYEEEACISRQQVVDAVRSPSTTRMNILNRLIDATLSRQVQFLRPDRKGELLLQGGVRFGSRAPVVDWEAIPLRGFDNLINRHRLSSPTRPLLQQLTQSQNGS